MAFRIMDVVNASLVLFNRKGKSLYSVRVSQVEHDQSK